VRWPGVLPEGTVSDQTAISLDLSKSIVRAAGAELPEDRPFEGIDLLKHVEEGRPDQPRALFWRARRGDRTWRAVRHGDLKYLTRRDGEKFQEHLFDLAADPAEQNDLLDARPADARRLQRLLAEWEERVRPERP
jgi:N-acetylgalactosamine-6-sulfatase